MCHGRPPVEAQLQIGASGGGELGTLLSGVVITDASPETHPLTK